jgi:hypothetical protein
MYSAHRPARSIGDAVRLFCLECCGSSIEYDKRGEEIKHYRAYDAVRDCPSERSCSLWKYRFGKNPDRKPSNPGGNPEALNALRAFNKPTDCPNPDANPVRVRRTRVKE